jgi:hypothetical protein
VTGDAGVWMNEYHADFLSRDRLAEARQAAQRRHLVATARRRPIDSPPAAPRGLWRRLAPLVRRNGRPPPRLL